MWTNPHHVICTLDYCNALCLILHVKSPQKVVWVQTQPVVSGSSCNASLMPVLHRLLSSCFFGTTKWWGLTYKASWHLGNRELVFDLHYGRAAKVKNVPKWKPFDVVKGVRGLCIQVGASKIWCLHWFKRNGKLWSSELAMKPVLSNFAERSLYKELQGLH